MRRLGQPTPAFLRLSRSLQQQNRLAILMKRVFRHLSKLLSSWRAAAMTAFILIRLELGILINNWGDFCHASNTGTITFDQFLFMMKFDKEILK